MQGEGFAPWESGAYVPALVAGQVPGRWRVRRWQMRRACVVCMEVVVNTANTA